MRSAWRFESWNKKESHAGHVGFYLTGDGRQTLEHAVSMHGRRYRAPCEISAGNIRCCFIWVQSF